MLFWLVMVLRLGDEAHILNLWGMKSFWRVRTLDEAVRLTRFFCLVVSVCDG